MKKTLITTILSFAFLFIATPAFASNMSGYAWSESVGWFDFQNATLEEGALI